MTCQPAATRPRRRGDPGRSRRRCHGSSERAGRHPRWRTPSARSGSRRLRRGDRRRLGSLPARSVDAWLVASIAPTQRIAGPRLDTLHITASTEGAAIPRVYGRMRIGRQHHLGDRLPRGDDDHAPGRRRQGRRRRRRTEVTEYCYFASFAVALCEGPIAGIGRIWADGKPLDRAASSCALHRGRRGQDARPLIAAKEGAATRRPIAARPMWSSSGCRSAFGNRIPQLSFEVFRPIADGDRPRAWCAPSR